MSTVADVQISSASANMWDFSILGAIEKNLKKIFWEFASIV